MVDYGPESEILEEIHRNDLMDEGQGLAHVLSEDPAPSGLGDSSLIWDYGSETIVHYSENVIQETGHPDVDELPCTEQMETIYYSEPGPSIEESTILYEEITKARCIDCDKVVDIDQPSEARKHHCALFKKLSCNKCGTRFNLSSNLRVHNIIAHVKQEEFIQGTSCEICEGKSKKKFQRFFAFIAHLKTHTRNDNFLCSTCCREFEFSCMYNRHRRIEHGIGETSKRAVSCSELGYCNKCELLMEQSKVEAHRLTHNAHLRLERKAKAKEKQPILRKTKAMEKRKNVCETCQKAFVRPTELKRHMAVHEKTPQFKCFICGRTFAHLSGLRAHKKTVHAEEKPKFPCSVCGTTFNKKSNCDRHVKDVHPLNSKKPMAECHLCACQFKNLGALNKHLLKVHKAEKVTPEEIATERILPVADVTKSSTSGQNSSALPHKCFKCDKRFKLRSSLKIHFDVHARKEIDDPVLTDPKCPICLKHLSSKNNLRRHLLTHQNNYECPDCCQKFHSIHRLDRHKCYRAVAVPNGSYQQDILVNPATIRTSAIPSKSYFCKQCPSSFFSFKGYKEHKALHSGLRPHLCWTCHKSFRTADLLAMHKEIHTREPVYCEYCPLILNGRAQYGAHLRAVHQNRQNALPSSSTLLPNRGAGISSSQSEYCADRGPMEGFRTRAQSADIEPREFDGNTWIPMGNTETVSDRPVRCPFCCHQFLTVAHLTQHFANTQNERDHSFAVVQCPLCDMSMQGSVEAFQHFSSVHTYVFHDPQSAQMAVYGLVETMELRYEAPPPPAKKYQCPHCSSGFQKPSDLVRHMRIHTGERPYECSICSRRFSLRSSLNAHVKIHSRGDPEFECSLCSAKFYNRNALSLHLRIHTGEKPLKCRACTTTFRTSSGRKLHEQTVHQIVMTPKNKIIEEDEPTNCRLPKVILAPPSIENLPTTTLVDRGNVYPVAVQRTLLPVKARNTDDLIINTLAQISRVEPTPLPITKGSAFSKKISQNEAQYIHITARRISITEYTVTIARKGPTAIREGVDTTASVALATLRNLAEQNTPMRLTLMDNQQLNVMAKGVLDALGDAPQMVLRAHPYNPTNRCSVELLPPHHTDFCSRCDICDVDLPTKEISDTHFTSEDHETAQVLHPLADAVQDTIDDSLLIAPAVSHHRREEVTCKLCGRKFLDTEPLVAHIRLEHERDHPHSLAPRPIARTAPPLEASRHQTTF